MDRQRLIISAVIAGPCTSPGRHCKRTRPTHSNRTIDFSEWRREQILRLLIDSLWGFLFSLDPSVTLLSVAHCAATSWSIRKDGVRCPGSARVYSLTAMRSLAQMQACICGRDISGDRGELLPRHRNAGRETLPEWRYCGTGRSPDLQSSVVRSL